MQTLKPVSELVSSSWNIYKNDFKKLTRILAWYLIFTAGFIILSIVKLKFKVSSVTEILLSLALIVSNFICIPALLEYISSGQKISVSQTFKQSKPKIWPFVWTGFLSGLIALGGFSLLIIPGIYLSVCFSFSQYLVISEKKSGVQALWESTKLIKNQWFAVFLRIAIYTLGIWALVSIVGWLDKATNTQGYLANIMTFVISFFSPLFMLYFYQIYKNLRSINKSENIKVPAKIKVWYTSLAIIGTVAIVVLVVVSKILTSNTIVNKNTLSGDEIQNQYKQYLNSVIAEQALKTTTPLSTD